MAGVYNWCIVCTGRLTWLVYIIGAVIGGRVSFASTDEHDEMDGELVCRSEYRFGFSYIAYYNVIVFL